MSFQKILLFIFVFFQLGILNARGVGDGNAADSLQANVADSVVKKKNWKFSGTASLTMTQSSYTNWAAGGQNSVAGVATTSLALRYAKDKLTWDNSLDAAYGLLLQGTDSRSKTDDRLEFASKLGYRVSKSWYYSFLTQMKTQFDKGYSSYPIKDKALYTSRFFAPGYISFSLGMDYTPNKNLSLFLSPITMRNTFVLDDMISAKGDYGMDPGDHVRSDYGGFLKMTYKKEVIERVMLKTKLELFSNWADKPQNVDLNLEVNVDFKVTKWLATRFYAQMLYDDNIHTINADTGELEGAKLQFKEVLGIGLSYIF